MAPSVYPTLDWRSDRRRAIGAIAITSIIGSSIWIAVDHYSPLVSGAASLSTRMLVTLKCLAVATLFCLVTGIEAIAHERLQTAAFDPLKGHRPRRLEVNLRYLQNTLEQLVVFTVALFGLAAYMDTEESMRAVIATTVVWVIGRFAFWLGYHHSSAMRAAGAPAMAITMLTLVYVVWRIGRELAGTAGASGLVASFFIIEALLFWFTRDRKCEHS